MSRLEKITHILLIAVCIVSLAVLLQRHLARRAFTSALGPYSNISAKAVHPDNIGDRVTLDGIKWNASPINVVIAIRSGCKHCEASMPLYRQISDVRRQRGDAVSFVAVSTDAAATIRDLLSKARVNVDTIVQSSFETIGIDGTPTLLVVDGQGILRAKFLGELNPPHVKALLSMLSQTKTLAGIPGNK